MENWQVSWRKLPKEIQATAIWEAADWLKDFCLEASAMEYFYEVEDDWPELLKAVDRHHRGGMPGFLHENGFTVGESPQVTSIRELLKQINISTEKLGEKEVLSMARELVR